MNARVSNYCRRLEDGKARQEARNKLSNYWRKFKKNTY